MKTFPLAGWQTRPALREVTLPEPGPGAVFLKIGGVGACHSASPIPRAEVPWQNGRLSAAPERAAEENWGYQS